jgi:hypothetical protein
MSIHGNDEPVLIYSDGGWVGYRAFVHKPSNVGACLASLAKSYSWKAGRIRSDAVPTFQNSNGFYAHKSLPEAIYQSGGVDGLIFALTEHWGEMVEGSTGLRSEWAEIVAIIQPERARQIELFPWEDLARDYPDVPIVEQTELRRIFSERGMVPLARALISPVMQWIGPDGELVWGRETIGPEGYEMLPAAATYPEELHPADQRLRKVYFHGPQGERYVIWEVLGTEMQPPPGFSEAYRMVEFAAEHMYRHLDPEQPDSESQGGEQGLDLLG